MSNEYGQQPYPGHQPPVPGYGAPAGSGYPQQQGQGYPGTPPGGQPVYAGQPYPQGGGGYGSGYGQAPIDKPGGVTGAAVLGFVQAGITLITTAILFFGLIGTASAQTDAALGWIVAFAQLAGLILLIFGAVQLLSGSNRSLYLIGVIVELLICGYYLVNIVTTDTGGVLGKQFEDLKAAMTVIPIVFAVMPIIGLILALGSGTTRWLQAKRGH
ncbi:MAG: hypothetical protein ABW224_13005 [Kibdelosporangium sp.]